VITLYPAIDLQNGRAVRLVQGDFERSTVFNEDPVDQARAFAEAGATALHVVDLDGARGGEPVHAATAATIAAQFSGTVHYGGGLRSKAAIETALAAGADRLVVGTAVLHNDGLLRWAIERLSGALVVALDAREGMVATHGWTRISDRRATDVAAELLSTGVRHLLYTDIDRDGMLGGPNLAALASLARAAPPLSVIASGGIGSLDDLHRLVELDIPSITGVVVGRALYEGRFTVREAIGVLAA
jgi:phosphoribosylformimino-5-aminoimidazole carboxamide ribotide isomerase